MHDPKYYEWLYSINGTANPGHCLVLNELPFMTPLAAITFVAGNFPEMDPKQRPIVSDPARCSDIASHSQHEVEYLITQLEKIVEDLKSEAESYSRESEKYSQNNLFSKVQRDLNEEYARDKRNQAIGILQAISRLRSRKVELSSLAGKGRYSDWRLE